MDRGSDPAPLATVPETSLNKDGNHASRVGDVRRTGDPPVQSITGEARFS
jgi:hypothetical protein